MGRSIRWFDSNDGAIPSSPPHSVSPRKRRGEGAQAQCQKSSAIALPAGGGSLDFAERRRAGGGAEGASPPPPRPASTHALLLPSAPPPSGRAAKGAAPAGEGDAPSLNDH